MYLCIYVSIYLYLYLFDICVYVYIKQYINVSFILLPSPCGFLIHGKLLRAQLDLGRGRGAEERLRDSVRGQRGEAPHGVGQVLTWSGWGFRP